MVNGGDQDWYWSPEWQAMEAEADDDLAAGRVVGPMDEDGFEIWLDALESKG